jgi:hypothetical protein
MYVQVGIYPWYAVHERRYGYEPLFVYDRWYYGRHDPAWEIGIRRDYDYRVAHIDARPPRTYAAALRIDAGGLGVKFTLAAPLARVAVAGGGVMRFEHINAERREQFVKSQHELQQIQNERRNTEFKANAQARASGGNQPVRMNISTSSMATSRQPTTAGARGAATEQSTAAGGTPSGKTAGSGVAANGRTMTSNGSTPRTGTATSRTSNASGKGRNPREKDKDKEQGGR